MCYNAHMKTRNIVILGSLVPITGLAGYMIYTLVEDQKGDAESWHIDTKYRNTLEYDAIYVIKPKIEINDFNKMINTTVPQRNMAVEIANSILSQKQVNANHNKKIIGAWGTDNNADGINRDAVVYQQGGPHGDISEYEAHASADFYHSFGHVFTFNQAQYGYKPKNPQSNLIARSMAISVINAKIGGEVLERLKQKNYSNIYSMGFSYGYVAVLDTLLFGDGKYNKYVASSNSLSKQALGGMVTGGVESNAIYNGDISGDLYRGVLERKIEYGLMDPVYWANVKVRSKVMISYGTKDPNIGEIGDAEKNWLKGFGGTVREIKQTEHGWNADLHTAITNFIQKNQ